MQIRREVACSVNFWMVPVFVIPRQLLLGKFAQYPEGLIASAFETAHSRNRTVQVPTIRDIEISSQRLQTRRFPPFHLCTWIFRLRKKSFPMAFELLANDKSGILFLLDEPRRHHDIRIDRPERHTQFLRG